MTLSERIFKSNNKIKTAWNIINELLGKQQSMQGIQRLTVDRTPLTNQQDIANAINEYFSSITNPESNNENPVSMQYDNITIHNNHKQDKGTPAPPLVFKSFSTHEITLLCS